eukprot:1139010-Pelagomonas_calceolata.AAC.4
MACVQDGERTVAMVNNLGASTNLEMNCMTYEALTQLKARNELGCQQKRCFYTTPLCVTPVFLNTDQRGALLRGPLHDLCGHERCLLDSDAPASREGEQIKGQEFSWHDVSSFAVLPSDTLCGERDPPEHRASPHAVLPVQPPAPTTLAEPPCVAPTFLVV